jgi:hypothetical protein
MKLSLGAKSLILFGLSVLFLILMTLFDSALATLPIQTERIIGFLFLVLPGVMGVFYGVASIAHKELRPWMAILGTLLNALFALFHLFVISFAG